MNKQTSSYSKNKDTINSAKIKNVAVERTFLMNHTVTGDK